MIRDPGLADGDVQKELLSTPRGRPTDGAGRVPKRPRQLVLLAEDDPNDMRMYGMTLWYNGFDVLEAEDGEAAVQLTREHQPDLVLVDLLLPRLTGIEVCRRIRQAGIEVPVIALTGRDRREFGSVARDAGCVDYLEKPISPLQVLHTVEDFIGRPPLPGEDPDPDRYPARA